MAQSDTRVIGHFALLSPTDVLCTDGGACMIAGSGEAMAQYLGELPPGRSGKATVRKTSFGEIRRGLSLGAAYAFDREAYARFHPLALEAGIPVEAADFDRPGHRFLTVQLVRR
jgi:hypothetical protein